MSCTEFLHTLAQSERTGADWPELSTAMLALRLVDDAMRTGAVSSQSVAFTLIQLRGVPDLERNREIAGIVEAARGLGGGVGNGVGDWRRTAGVRLLAYGLNLRRRGVLRPALDVLKVASAVAEDEIDLRLGALAERAYVFRLLQRFDDAEYAYQQILALATEMAHPHMRLEAELGLAKLLVDRGNIPAGEAATHAVLAESRAERDAAMEGKALLDAARIAGIRRRPIDVLRYSLEALPVSDDPGRRDRIYMNMAHALRELGRGNEAEQLAGYVADRSGEADQRAFATILLYHIAIDRDNWPIAACCRRELAGLSLTPLMAAEYYEAMGREHAAKRETAAAILALQQALDVADEHQLAEMTIRVDAAMADVRRGLVPRLYEYRTPVAALSATERAQIESISAEVAALCA